MAKIENIGEVSRICPEYSPEFLTFALPNSGLSRTETLHAIIPKHCLDEICIQGLGEYIKNRSLDKLYDLKPRFGTGLLIDALSIPWINVRKVFCDTSAEPSRPIAGVDATISYFGSHELLQFRKWKYVAGSDTLWVLSGREPLEEYPPVGEVWSGDSIIEACSKKVFDHPALVRW